MYFINWSFIRTFSNYPNEKKGWWIGCTLPHQNYVCCVYDGVVVEHAWSKRKIWRHYNYTTPFLALLTYTASRFEVQCLNNKSLNDFSLNMDSHVHCALISHAVKRWRFTKSVLSTALGLCSCWFVKLSILCLCICMGKIQSTNSI